MRSSENVVQSARLKDRVHKTNRGTAAAKWNAKTLDGLQKALRKVLEVNLAHLLTTEYSETLESFKSIPKPNAHSVVIARKYDLRVRLDPIDRTDIVCELSSDIRNKLRNYDSLPIAIVELLAGGDILFEAPSVTVLRLGAIAAKITADDKAITEDGSLSYLEEHLPGFPAPRSHGLVKMGAYYLLFTAYVPGITLEKAWPQLSIAGKLAVRDQLEELLSQLRSLPFPEDKLLGGVRGEGCKDIRRTLRVSSKPIMDSKQFEDFIFTSSKIASLHYINFLRKLMPERANHCVFTHGDFRPANILVQMEEGGGTCVVQGIIDWEASGFYPAYWESVKATNNLTPSEDLDWYDYLPQSASPRKYSIPWLIDRLWDRNMENS